MRPPDGLDAAGLQRKAVKRVLSVAQPSRHQPVDAPERLGDPPRRSSVRAANPYSVSRQSRGPDRDRLSDGRWIKIAHLGRRGESDPGRGTDGKQAGGIAEQMDQCLSPALARIIQCAVTRRYSSAGANPARQLSCVDAS